MYEEENDCVSPWMERIAALEASFEALRQTVEADRALREQQKEAEETKIMDMFRFFKSATAEAKTGSNGFLRQVGSLDWRTVIHLMAHRFYGIDVPKVARNFEEVRNELWKHVPSSSEDKTSSDAAKPEELYLGKKSFGHKRGSLLQGLSPYPALATIQQLEGALEIEMRQSKEGVAGGYYGKKKVEEMLYF